jgi:hypothetical protein
MHKSAPANNLIDSANYCPCESDTRNNTSAGSAQRYTLDSSRPRRVITSLSLTSWYIIYTLRATAFSFYLCVSVCVDALADGVEAERHLFSALLASLGRGWRAASRAFNF